MRAGPRALPRLERGSDERVHPGPIAGGVPTHGDPTAIIHAAQDDMSAAHEHLPYGAARQDQPMR
ncbi:hypothetical protein GCM10027300_22920 [Modestobacter lapidis]